MLLRRNALTFHTMFHFGSIRQKKFRQKDFFEHRLRSDESAQEKSDYILVNPVRAGLVPKPEDWPYA